MNAHDELRELWCSQADTGKTRGEDLVKLVQKKTKLFDRMIHIRNVMECAAALVLTVCFGMLAMRTQDPLQRIGFIVVAASGLWIIFFMLRYGRAAAAADPDRDLSDYRRTLVERYDRQIWLLKSVKYWYLLPPWIGLLIGTVGVLLQEARIGRLGWWDFIAPAIYTGVFAFVWWLNEVYGVARLRIERARVLALAGEVNDPENRS